ncbi:MAG: hypothetical protein ACK41P_01265 [Asticcacaulis sp.]
MSESALKARKGAKGLACGIAAAVLFFGQAAAAYDASTCPTGLGGNGWNIDKIRDFGLYMGQPEKQLMLCLHRGLHSNYNDNIDPDFKQYTTDVPDNSWEGLNLGFRWAPCVEVDVTSRTLDKEADQAGSSRAVLAHEALANRMVSNGTLVLGNKVRLPDGCTKVPGQPAGTTYRATCKIKPLYNRATDTYSAPTPSERIPFRAKGNDILTGTQKSLISGSLRTVYSSDQSTTGHDIVRFADLLKWVNKCRKEKNSIGLVVLDLKTAETIPDIYNDFKAFYDALPVGERAAFTRHFFVKTKPWKMYLTYVDQDAAWLTGYLDKFADLGVPAIDTIAQAGTDNTKGSEPIAGVDYKAVEPFFERRTSDVSKNRGRFAYEIVVPGTSRYNPLRSGKLTINMPSDCNYGSYSKRSLAQIADLSRTCNKYSRAGTGKPKAPQIWGWVPLEDARAAKLIKSDGTSAVPGSASQYVSFDGKFPFGIASGAAEPQAFRVDQDNQERVDNWVTNEIGARAITIDSVSKFRTMFTGYTTSQNHFGWY